MKNNFSFVFLFAMALEAGAAVQVARPFADHAVLQRGRPVPVWGVAAPGEAVEISFAGVTVKTAADGKGKWRADLPPMKESAEGRTLTVKGAANTVEIKDVLVGEVWFVGGQSNAVCPFWCEKGPRFRDLKGAMIAQYVHRPLIRCTAKPGSWTVFEPANLVDVTHPAGGSNDGFSAMGVYFALELHAALGVPVGMIGAYANGTGIDTWIPREGYETRPDLKDMMEWVRPKKWTKECVKGPIVAWHQQPSLLWEGSVAPWTPYALRGVLWNQGDSNVVDAPRYCSKMHALYNGWAKNFGNPDLKLYYVEQGRVDGSCWELQRQQAKFAGEQPNAAMSGGNDLAVPDVHGKDKEMEARRLLLHALKHDYGFADIRDESPALASWKIDGDAFVLSFSNARTLYVYNKDFSLKANLEIAGEDGVWRHADITNFTNAGWASEGYIGSSGLIVRAKGVSAPKKVRYLAKPPTVGNIYNEVCLPLLPFEAGE